MIYHVCQKNGIVIISNASKECLRCMVNVKKTNTTVTCMLDGRKKRIGKAKSSKHNILICDIKFANNHKLFGKQISLMKFFANDIESIKYKFQNDYNRNIIRFLHNIEIYNARMLQELYLFLPKDTVDKKGAFVIKELSSSIANNSEEYSLLFMKLLRNNYLLKSEFSIFKKLYNADLTLKIEPHNLRTVLLSVLNIFMFSFITNNVNIIIQDYSEKINFDFESVCAALAHLFDNVSKYIYPSSDLSISFCNQNGNTVVFIKMISMAIEMNEVDNLCKEGYSGMYPKKLNLNGSGIGLFMVNKLLKLNKATLKVLPDVTTRFTFTNKKGQKCHYQNNTFQISFINKI